ncbi:ATP-binding protein [Sphaerotilus mobilis]|uniref:4Fe-4S dicluster protein n=1 Tax=Sphaerotilus mobilis TaxID=47994 RepID=A0A4Q7LLQ7_9BURK|nr:4Fe-4S binding protein [Sphaerotilus mobilis]RZS54568.1 4Fe-4S dicluster protein [Sphaerotilus mobilis]
MTAPRPSPALPRIDPGRCTGCGWCVPTCHVHLLSLQVSGPEGRKTSTLRDPQDCTGCAKCAVRCPFDAIAMVRRRSPPQG